MDYHLYRIVNGLTGNAFADHLLKLLATGLPAVLAAIVAVTFLIPWRARHDERRAGAVLGTAAAGLALLAAQPIAHAVERLRPYAAHPKHAHLLIARSHDPSFPSDHATGAMALAIGVWLYDRTIGTVLLVLAGILCFARVYVGTHYPGDVAAGALLAATAVALLRIPPVRHVIEAFATRAGKTWDRLVLRRPGSHSEASAA